MRLHILFTKNDEIVPFNYQQLLIKTFHRWLGHNEIHDTISLYSLSWLKGAEKDNGGLNFPNGAKWFINFWENDYFTDLLKGIQEHPLSFMGMQVREVQFMEDPTFGSREKFFPASPIFIRKYDENGRAIHLNYFDADADRYLTETLSKKLAKASLNYKATVSFDKNNPTSKTKVININGVNSKANFCPVIIEGDKEALKFAWNVGIGHSTGCCFGSIY